MKKGKRRYTLLSVSFEILGGDDVEYLPSVMYIAIPLLMPIPSVAEIEAIIKKRGAMNAICVFAVSSVGEVSEERLPSGGCIKMSRDGDRSSRFIFDEKWDKGPKMVRMDWKV